MRRDGFAGEAASLELLPPAAVTASGNGTGVDLQGRGGLAAVVLHSAAGTGTSPTLDVKLQHSHDDSTYVDVGSAFDQVDDTAGGSLQTIAINTDGLRRYLRLVKTAGGTTPSFVCSAILRTINR